MDNSIIRYLSTLYRSSLSLLTDMYELTMAYGYWKTGFADREAMFSLFFRRNPFEAAYSIACGLGTVIEFIQDFSFNDSDIRYLESLTDSKGNTLFETAFLVYLRKQKIQCDISGVPEGSPVFPFEPLLRVSGPLLHCQILESALLNILNYQTLIATKAARMYLSAGGDPILEFGLRRSHGVDGGVMASRASYIGGCAGSSNLLAGKLFGIPAKGTHAHSWVMVHDTELEAFRHWADIMPNNAIMLVDTYKTLQGVRHVIDVACEMREKGYEIGGIRLDSGDLYELSHQARSLLDEAGFENVSIVASGDLDEYAIADLKQKKAPIDLWGVGTKLVTAYDDPALGGVYKLTAMKDEEGAWQFKIKVSEDTIKQTLPGELQIKRFEQDGVYIGDLIYEESTGTGDVGECVDLVTESARYIDFSDAIGQDVLIPVFRGGELVYDLPDIIDCRQATLHALDMLPKGCKKLTGAKRYLVGIEKKLHQHQQFLLRKYDL